MNVECVREAARLMRQAQSLLAQGPLDFYLTELVAAHDLLMRRFAPFKIGDHVQLIRVPEITEQINCGWLPYKHFLAPGARGVIVSAECGSRGFRFGVEFRRETWLDRTGREQSVSDKSLFMFGEADLAKAEETERAKSL